MATDTALSLTSLGATALKRSSSHVLRAAAYRRAPLREALLPRTNRSVLRSTRLTTLPPTLPSMPILPLATRHAPGGPGSPSRFLKATWQTMPICNTLPIPPTFTRHQLLRSHTHPHPRTRPINRRTANRQFKRRQPTVCQPRRPATHLHIPIIPTQLTTCRHQLTTPILTLQHQVEHPGPELSRLAHHPQVPRGTVQQEAVAVDSRISPVDPAVLTDDRAPTPPATILRPSRYPHRSEFRRPRSILEASCMLPSLARRSHPTSLRKILNL